MLGILDLIKQILVLRLHVHTDDEEVLCCERHRPNSSLNSDWLGVYTTEKPFQYSRVFVPRIGVREIGNLSIDKFRTLLF